MFMTLFSQAALIAGTDADVSSRIALVSVALENL